jgi:hypothetical protein
MVELFAIWLACKNIGNIARDRGIRARPFQVRVVLLWFIFEVASLFIARAVGIRGPLVYAAALGGALLSLKFSFTAARNAVPRQAQPPTEAANGLDENSSGR